MVLDFFLGTAAELIKLHPLIVRARARGWTTRLWATGQGATNLEDQARDFGLDPAEWSWITPRTRDLATAGAALAWFARVNLARWRPPTPGNIALVHGDTLSTLAGARLARRAGATVAHVEAGLRSPSLLNPFPEEILRRRVSRLADLHFAPDPTAAAALRRARVRGDVVDTGGNTLMDAVRDGAPGDGRRDFILVNVHRFENLNSDARWAHVIDVVLAAARTRAVVFVAHPPTRHRLEREPATRARLHAAGVEVVDRVPFSRFISWLKAADALISDGGSNQEECSYLGTPCLILRHETERREGLGENCVLARFDPAVSAEFLSDPARYRRPPVATGASPSEVILNHLAARA